MFNEINEPIDVACRFIGNKIIPLKFFWPASAEASAGRHGREIAVKTVNLTWSSWEGRSKIYYFAVSDSVNYFKLRFNSENLKWTLLESYTD